MKKLLIVSAFGELSPGNNSRLNNIYNYATAEKQVVTTDFDHTCKEYKKEIANDTVFYLHVPSYKNNVSFRRIYSHLCFAFRLKRFLKRLPSRPDIIYCAMPTSASAWVCGKFCKKERIKFVIDIVDIWPDSLIPLAHKYSFFSFLLFPWKYMTKKAYRFADVILGESKKYIQIASSYNPSVPAYLIYLGIDPKEIEDLRNESKISLEKPENELWICYAGSLGNSYDFDTLLNAVQSLNTIYRYKLLFIGDGDKRDYIEQKIEHYNLNASITGIVSYADYLKYLSYCDIGINIFKKNTRVAHSYKFNDYVASNLFILNNLIGETAELVDTYRMGRNFNFSDCLLEDVLKDVCKNWTLYKGYRENNINVINDVLNKKTIYSNVLSEIIKG
jgi:hypothetical protein